ncbi:MAG: tetratricopeptide repeat protein [bacterium]|nr:tetratricopeptide repeat protein [bacterium]
MSKREIRILSGITLAAIFFAALSRIVEYDVWSHLSYGREFWEHLRFPLKSDLLAIYTPADGVYPTEEWLFGVIIYLFFQLGGLPGLTLFQAVLIGITFYFLLRAALMAGKAEAGTRGAYAVCFLILAAALSARDRFQVRPELFLYFFLALELYLFTLYIFRGRRGALCFIPLVQLFWVNLHPTYVLTFYLLGLLLLLGILPGLFRNQGAGMFSALPPYKLRPLLWVGGAVLAATLINPRFYEAGLVTLSYIRIPLPFSGGGGDLRAQLLKDAVFEFRTPVFSNFLNLYGVILLLGLVSFFLTVRKPDLFGLGLALPLFLLSTRSVRFLALGAIVWGFVAAKNLGIYLNARAQTASRPRPAGRWKNPALILSAIFIVGGTAACLYQDREEFPVGLGASRALFPEKSLAFLERNGVSGPVFNNVRFGGFIQWWGKGRLLPFIDGHWLLPDRELEDYLKANVNFESFRRLEQKYNFNLALIEYRNPRDRDLLLTALPRADWGLISASWPLVFFDDAAMAYLKPSPENAGLISARGFHYLFPANSFGYFAARAREENYLVGLRTEVTRQLAADPDSFRARIFAAWLPGLAGDYPESLRGLQALTHLIPSDRKADFYASLASAREGLGQKKEAEKYRRLAQKENPGAAPASPRPGTESGAQQALREAVTLTLSGRTAEAVDKYREVLEAEPRNPEVLTNLGFLYLQMKRYKEARESLEAVLEIDRRVAAARYGLGRIFSEQGDRSRARLEFRECARLDPAGRWGKKAQVELGRLP